jgi:GTPase
VIVITKYDLATKLGLRQTLSKVLSTLKEAGRIPQITSDQGHSPEQTDLHTISAGALDNVKGIIQQLEKSPLSAVPILLTSAVKGTGINKLHALLRQLPLPVRIILDLEVELDLTIIGLVALKTPLNTHADFCIGPGRRWPIRPIRVSTVPYRGCV